MDQKLNARQQEAYDAIQLHGQIKKGGGFRFTTARALAARALVTLEERRDAGGTLYYWAARRVTPAAAPAVSSTTVASSTTPPAPAAATPKGTHVIRVAVRNTETEAVTFTGVSHVQGLEGLKAELSFLGVPVSDQPHGTGGQYTTEDGTRRYVWRELSGGALSEFVYGGEVFRLQPHARFSVTTSPLWAVVKADTDDVVAADPRPWEAESRAKADLASLNRALMIRKPRETDK